MRASKCIEISACSKYRLLLLMPASNRTRPTEYIALPGAILDLVACELRPLPRRQGREWSRSSDRPVTSKLALCSMTGSHDVSRSTDSLGTEKVTFLVEL